MALFTKGSGLGITAEQDQSDTSTRASEIRAVKRASEQPSPPPSPKKTTFGKEDLSDRTVTFSREPEIVQVDTQDTDFDEQLLMLTHKIHGVLVDELGGQQFKADDRERLRPVAEQVMNDVMKDEKPLMPRRKSVLLEEVLNEVLGFGPIQYLLNDASISEVMVNSPKEIFIEREGRILQSRRRFVDERHVMNIIDRIVRPLGKQANA